MDRPACGPTRRGRTDADDDTEDVRDHSALCAPDGPDLEVDEKQEAPFLGKGPDRPDLRRLFRPVHAFCRGLQSYAAERPRPGAAVCGPVFRSVLGDPRRADRRDRTLDRRHLLERRELYTDRLQCFHLPGRFPGRRSARLAVPPQKTFCDLRFHPWRGDGSIPYVCGIHHAPGRYDDGPLRRESLRRPDDPVHRDRDGSQFHGSADPDGRMAEPAAQGLEGRGPDLPAVPVLAVYRDGHDPAL